MQPWFASGATNGILIISDVSSFTQRLRLKMRGGCTSLRFLPGTALLAVGTAKGVVTIIDSRDGTMKTELEGHAGPIFDTWSKGSVLWTCGDDALCRKYLMK